jgi:hypothetical protein
MTADRTSHELLAHFDRPKVAVLDDFEWVEECAPNECGIAVERAPAERWRVGRQERPRLQPPNENDEDQEEVLTHPTRGVGWVLCWAGAIAVLACATSVLTQFAFTVAAENALNAAARAAAVEATLPRATYQTIWETVERRLASYPDLAQQLQFSLLQNGTPAGGRFRAAAGDRITVELSAPTFSALPDWLRRISFRQEQAPIHGRAERDVPGRKLHVARMSAPSD